MERDGAQETIRRKPARTCIVCRSVEDKNNLIRIVRTSDGSASVDPTGKAAGRGAYVCATMNCIERAIQRQRLGAALKTALDAGDYKRIEEELKRCVKGCDE